ncbi:MULTISPECIES: Fe-S cluster assembly protein SufD [Leeuwenhoekiella]|jgi:Fe-S cluster assembly protein SufD|uniref:FeS assembly protein SufD n=1 Tax=Leeuwenhoekiella blandensis (strain CECT 7118 / CCUG 51940 / KCTC 22103 / MED217) TaxID=398720 RepID=A3XHH9_LEEBM|nr:MULTISPECIES: Fe-S cluster assembly protein SufD [Leeuwenhoekiella]EAQ51266.1 FeS assembly protein SufD [Leeuwenhoekiella blandensis MED217]MAO43431.1 Fe-S cluster assembly protein SufD [Leeuwenhoekiella sp.]HCW65265.1 Fe-S cluster assembly protein SufD [Leeuwenhoekiella sp.]|tara:strand:+ start:3306 stop:4619 length:1314 start_codon:yes stop_codon:yes gene_type:complete
MSLKDKLLSSYLTFQENTSFDNSILDIKDQAIKVFETEGFPSKKDENWKYTSLNSVTKPDYSLVSHADDAIEFKDVKQYFLNDIDTFKIVFIDGVYSSYLSETTHDGVDVCLLSSALTKPKFKQVIDVYFNKIAKKESLTALNTAFAKEGAYIYVPKSRAVNKPIQIVHLSTGSEANLMLQPRNLIVAEENAEVQVIERHQSLSSNAVFTNSVTEIYAGKHARVDYYKIQNDKENASLIDNTHIDQQESSEVSVHTFSFGGKLTRNNLNYYQNGEHINSILKGVTIIEDKQHVDHNTLVHHRQPNCESHQDYKGIFDDRATGVFNGKVVVDDIAQKINAYQSNNNILVSDKASINSKPQLEIFADDVRCSHGCTIGQLDEDALFYMRTRGIGKKEGRALLMYAFANNVLESVKIPQLKARITNLIAEKLGVNIGFDL